MDLLSFIIGVAVGIFVFLLTYWMLSKSKSKTPSDAENLPQRIRSLEIELSSVQTEKEQLTREEESLTKKIENLGSENIELHRNLAAREESLQNLKEKLNNQAKDLEETRKTFQTEFKNLANDILEEKTKKFTEQNSKRLDEILIPFKDQIKGFEKRVEDTYQKTIKDQTDLQAELKKLQDLNLKISQEATNLTKALKGDVKKQGNWGEMILERVLERSGLTKGVEYQTQESFTTDEGKRLQPDVVVHLPDSKHILIDAKVSLIAYDEWINSEQSDQQNTVLKSHLLSVRKHVKELAEKNYQNTTGLQTPDFVLLFMPIEASFSIAVKEDPNLFNEAWEHKIVIVSPTTLLATLMTIASIWKQENQTKHAEKIAEEGAKLYDKFVNFLSDLEKLGKRLENAVTHYDDSIKKLKTGPGNLISKVENLKQMGIRSKSGKKSLPTGFTDYESED